MKIRDCFSKIIGVFSLAFVLVAMTGTELQAQYLYVSVTAPYGDADEGEDAIFRIYKNGGMGAALGDIYYTVSTSNADGTLSSDNPIFLPSNWTYVDVHVSDTTTSGGGTITVTLQSDAGYTIVSPSSATVDINEPPNPYLRVHITALDETVDEPESTTIRVVRDGGMSSEGGTIYVSISDTVNAYGALAYQNVNLPAYATHADVTLTNPTAGEGGGTITVQIDPNSGYTIESPGSVVITVNDGPD